MDSGELIELFYNRAYEKFVNKQILDDKNYIVPRQQLTSYVYELVNIPFIDFIDYIKHNEIDKKLEPSDITQFSSFPSCEMEMCKALLWANNPGCQYVDIGRLFPNKLISRCESAYRRFGEIHIKASTQLGLTFEYYNYWYLSCLGYIYLDLNEDVRMQLLARTITRNLLYQQLLIDILRHDVKPEIYMDFVSEQTLKRRLRNVCTFLEICLEECKKWNIKTYSLIKSYDIYEKPADIKIPIGTSKNFCTYLDEFDYHILSSETTKELIKKYRKGDSKAYEILVKGYMRLVLSVARKYIHKGVEYDDLIQEGVLGLLTAIERFDYSLNSNFSEYANFGISRAIFNSINTLPFLIGVPFHQLSYHRKIHRAKDAYEAEYGYEPSANVLGEKSDMSTEFYTYLFSLPDNLSEIVKYVDNLDEFIDENAITDKQLMNESQNYYINTLLNNLDDRGREIIKKYYGIDVKHEDTLHNIGKEWGLTRERTRQIVAKGIKQLRDLAKGYVKQDIAVSYPKQQTTLTQERPAGVQMFLYDLRKNNITLTDVLCDIKNKTYYEPQKTQKQQNTNVVKHKGPGFTIKNESDVCCILYYGKRIYMSNGVIKMINGKFYRLRNTGSFCVHIIELGDFAKIATDLVIEAHSWTQLYSSLPKRNWEESVQDIVMDQFSGKYRIKVKDIWYNHVGEPLYSNKPINHNATVQPQKRTLTSSSPASKKKKNRNRSIKDINKTRYPVWTQQEERDLLAFYRAGMTYEQLARIFETSPVEIRNKLAFIKIMSS